MDMTKWVSAHMEFAFVMVVVAGAVSHWFMQWVNNASVGNLQQYWLQLGKMESVKTVVALIGGVLAAFAAGLTNVPADAAPSLIWGIMAMGYMGGLAGDFVFNRSNEVLK